MMKYERRRPDSGENCNPQLVIAFPVYVAMQQVPLITQTRLPQVCYVLVRGRAHCAQTWEGTWRGSSIGEMATSYGMEMVSASGA